MKIEKKVLRDALRVVGKVACQTSPIEELRSIRFCGCGDLARVSATNGVEIVMLDFSCEAEGVFDFSIELKALRETVLAERGKFVEQEDPVSASRQPVSHSGGACRSTRIPSLSVRPWFRETPDIVTRQ